MGVPWLAKMRLLYLAIFVLTTVFLLLYVAYMTTPRHRTTAPSLLISSDDVAPPIYHPLQSYLNNITQPDLSRGIPTKALYEAGHTDVSSEVCSDLGKNIQLLIVITSAPDHERARMAIRKTWGHYALRRDVAITFMLGSTSNVKLNEKIKKELTIFGDIVRGKFTDTYDNLTLKTISMLEWVDNYCPKAAFVLKSDDDMYINVSRLLAFIEKHKPEKRAIYGRLAKKWKPIRNKKSKYYVSHQQYKFGSFPDFTTGPAYLLPARLSKELYIATLNHTYFKLEDVLVTGIVANRLKIKRVHVPEFVNERISLTPCNVQRVMSIHMVRGAEQYDLWKKQQDGGAATYLEDGGLNGNVSSFPYFEFNVPRNVTTAVGQTAFLHCRVEQLGDKAVSWIRKRDLHILTAGILTYTSDQRFQVIRPDKSDNWTLQIKFPQLRDSGVYECQVNTEPKMSLPFRLNVIEAKARILGPSDLHVKAGSSVTLTCVINQGPHDLGTVFWYRGTEILETTQTHPNEADPSARVTILNEWTEGLTSRLHITSARLSDSGNYSCVPTIAAPTSVNVHVINGEHPAAMQHGNKNTAPLSLSLHCTLVYSISVFIIKHIR